jgi:hypothetical protein
VVVPVIAPAHASVAVGVVVIVKLQSPVIVGRVAKFGIGAI